MTNEEKAKIENPYSQYNGEWMQGYLSHMFEEGFVKACNWKDKQFKEFLNKKKAEEGIDGCRSSYQYVRLQLLNNIINELFGEETSDVDNTDRDE